MARDVREFAYGTRLVVDYPWGWNVAGRAMCADGRVRALKRIAITADTFFSVPASVTVNGRTVAGYVTVETADGYSTDTDEDPATLKFSAYQYRRNADALPAGMWRRNPR